MIELQIIDICKCGYRIKSCSDKRHNMMVKLHRKVCDANDLDFGKDFPNKIYLNKGKDKGKGKFKGKYITS